MWRFADGSIGFSSPKFSLGLRPSDILSFPRILKNHCVAHHASHHLSVFPTSLKKRRTARMSEPSFPGRVLIKAFKGVNKLVPWHKLPSFIGVFNLLAFCLELEKDNLHDIYPDIGAQGTTASCPMKDPRYLVTRNSNGLFNKLDKLLMGYTGMRFGRNVLREYTKKPTEEELLTLNPRVVSE
jgi:hypothetical protein